MIIDLILDRKDGDAYNSRNFYWNVMQYGEIGWDITRAMDAGSENSVKKALCDYAINNGYSHQCNYIKSVAWL